MAKQRTYFEKGTPERKWYLVDATDKTLGRISTRIATILQGKDKPTYTPHIDTGDFIVVINCEKLNCTSTDKTYYWHTGYPGGIKSESIEKRMSRKPEEVLKQAVKLMLPRTKLGREMLTKLKIYAGGEHPHAAQQPELMAENDKV